MHILSFSGLFKRMILMGGNAASEWSLGRKDRIMEAAAEVARKAGWKGEHCRKK
jgi:hypothetical protein